MKDQETHIEFKAKYKKKKILRCLNPQEKETSTLVENSEEEDEEEAWIEVKVKSFFITAHI
jgi:hypothetical protein